VERGNGWVSHSCWYTPGVTADTDRYFLQDRDWNEYNKGEDATMPWIWAFGDQQDRDVGFETTHENQEADYVHHVLKVS